MNMLANYIVCVVILSVSAFHFTSGDGEPCFHEKRLKNGICIKISACASELEKIKEREHPQLCNFEGNIPVVCCTDRISTILTLLPKERKSASKCKEYENTVKGLIQQCKIPRGFPSSTHQNGFVAEPEEFPHMHLEKAADALKFSKRIYHRHKSIIHGFVIGDIKNFANKFVAAMNGDICTCIGEFMCDIAYADTVALGYENANGTISYACGGSLISNDFVLTAAHCLNRQGLGLPTIVRLGSVNLTSIEDEIRKDVKIRKMFKHPEYAPPSKYNDIALLHLRESITFTRDIYPICLDAQDSESLTAIATGWGKSWGNPSTVLVKHELSIFANKKCSTFFDLDTDSLANGVTSDSQLCAGNFPATSHLCRARNDDSGGPLMQFTDKFCMYKLVGVTSIGDACLLEKRPRVYTRVSHYLHWIEKIVWP